MSTPRFIVNPGDVFGRWTVIRPYRMVFLYGRWRTYLWCECECGTSRAVLETTLYGGTSFSCGCYQKERVSAVTIKHGDTIERSPEYTAWNNMMARCTNPKHKSYANYGGRGIMVDLEWQDYQNFIRDMGRRPSPDHSIDRIDNDGNYIKDNCRWTTPDVQASNKNRKFRRAVLVNQPKKPRRAIL